MAAQTYHVFFGIFAEGEQEVAWLKDAGYGHLVSKMEGKQYSEVTLWLTLVA
jgi:hypothetical protein